MELQGLQDRLTTPMAGLSALSAVVISIVIAGCGSSGAGAISLPYTQSFAGSCDDWSNQDDDLLKAGCVDGEYQVLVRDARDSQIFSVPLDAVPSVSVTADMRLAGGPKPNLYGVGCFSTSRSGYWFVLALGAGGTTQGYAIISYEPGSEQAAVTSIAVKKQDVSAGARHRVRGECAGETLRMSVDGSVVLTAKNTLQLEAVEHSGVVLYPGESGSDVRFDNVTIGTL
jgi:hypothetical protein